MFLVALFLAVVIVALIVPWAFHGTNEGAFIVDIILVVILTIILYGCMS